MSGERSRSRDLSDWTRSLRREQIKIGAAGRVGGLHGRWLRRRTSTNETRQISPSASGSLRTLRTPWHILRSLFTEVSDFKRHASHLRFEFVGLRPARSSPVQPISWAKEAGRFRKIRAGHQVRFGVTTPDTRSMKLIISQKKTNATPRD